MTSLRILGKFALVHDVSSLRYVAVTKKCVEIELV